MWFGASVLTSLIENPIVSSRLSVSVRQTPFKHLKQNTILSRSFARSFCINVKLISAQHSLPWVKSHKRIRKKTEKNIFSFSRRIEVNARSSRSLSTSSATIYVAGSHRKKGEKNSNSVCHAMGMFIWSDFGESKEKYAKLEIKTRISAVKHRKAGYRTMCVCVARIFFIDTHPRERERENQEFGDQNECNEWTRLFMPCCCWGAQATEKNWFWYDECIHIPLHAFRFFHVSNEAEDEADK